MQSRAKYSVFGLIIDSELIFPELIPSEGQADVTIEFGIAPEFLGDNAFNGARFQILGDEYLLTIDTVARFYIKEGNNIIIHRLENSDERSLRTFILGPVLGVLLHIQGMLPIHASAVISKDEAILFSGKSGIGKSTIALALNRRGYSLVSDDICAVGIQDGNAVLFRGFPQMKQWSSTLKIFDMETEEFEAVRPNIEKKAYPVLNFTKQGCMKIRTIFFISTHNKEEIVIKELLGTEKFTLLKSNTYRQNFILHTGNTMAHFKTGTFLAGAVKMYHLIRPDTGTTPDDILDHINVQLSEF